MKVAEVLNILSRGIILTIRWKDDPSGLLVGDPDTEVKGILTALNPTLEVAEEAKKIGCNLIVSHHPLFKKPVNDLVSGEYYSDIIRFLIKNDISLISLHTPYDLNSRGVSYMLAEALGLKNIKPMAGIKEIKDIEINELYKIVVYAPSEVSGKIMKAIDEAGGASIGKYDHCYFVSKGEGSFRPGENSNPYIGKKSKVAEVEEVRIETVSTAWNRNRIYDLVKKAHPYEEPVIDIYPLDNNFGNFGLGAIGETEKKINLRSFAEIVSDKLGTKTLRIASRGTDEIISTVAVCGGSGAPFWENAVKSGAQVYLTSEFGHHICQEASKHINIIDATHHATEQFAKKGLKDYLRSHIGGLMSIKESLKDGDVFKNYDEL